MSRENDLEPKVEDENLLEEDIIEDWAEMQPYDNIEREFFHSSINKTANIISSETKLEKENIDKTEIVNNIEKMRKLSFKNDVEVRRAFSIRSSSYRKMNELKNIHPDINISLNRIVNAAFNHYYEYIKGGGEFEDY